MTQTEASYAPLFLLSKGGMGQVALAARRDGRFTRLLAVKRLLEAGRRDPDARTMFLEEARVAGLIHHPNVVGVIDVGEDAEGPFLVMEYIEGVSARELLIYSTANGIPLPVQLCTLVVAQVARALAEAHSLCSHQGTPLNLVHRDVSPHNIMIGYDGVARLTDFGIARALGREHKTQTGVIKGKIGYMAPELLRLEEASPASDLFALGVVLYELLTSSRLYGKGDSSRSHRILNEAPPDVGDTRPDTPPEVQALLLSLLAKDAAHRPASALSVAKSLELSAAQIGQEEGPLDLGEFVSEAFALERETRRQQVGDALERLQDQPRAGSQPHHAPRADLPTPSARRKLVAALAAAILIGTGALWFGFSRRADNSAQKIAMVELDVVSEPDRAMVTGERIGSARTPVQVRVERGQPVTLHFEADGYQSLTERVVPSDDLRVHVVLVPLHEDAADPVDTRTPSRPRPRARPAAPMRSFELFGD